MAAESVFICHARFDSAVECWYLVVVVTAVVAIAIKCPKSANVGLRELEIYRWNFRVEPVINLVKMKTDSPFYASQLATKPHVGSKFRYY